MLNLVRQTSFERKYKKLLTKHKDNEVNNVDITIENLLNNKITGKMNPHPITWKGRKVMDCHADYDLVILYTKSNNTIILIDLGTHKELGISESFNIDDIVDEFLIEMTESM